METDIQAILPIIQGAKKTLFILCGLPYSGKTHFCKEIAKHSDIAVLEIDGIFAKHGFDWSANRVPDAGGWERIFTEASNTVRGTLLRGSNIIYDSTSHTRSSRDDLRFLAQKRQASAQVILIECSPQTARRRWQTTQVTRTRPVLSEELLERTIREFEPPSDDEAVICIPNNEYE